LEERKIGKAVRTRSRPSAPARRLARDDAGRGRAQPRMALSRDVLPRPEAPAAARGFRVRRRLQADRTILVPAGELDQFSVPLLEEALSSVVGRGLPIVIDLGELTFIDSCGLWLITTIHSGCRQRGISLRLWGGCEHIQQVFEVTGLYDLLPFVSRHPGSAR
jgi:anti-sigma B factor antagonist